MVQCIRMPHIYREYSCVFTNMMNVYRNRRYVSILSF